MRAPSFEWDPAKDRANREKHGVGFAEAQAAFLDPDRLIFPIRPTAAASRASSASARWASG